MIKLKPLILFSISIFCWVSCAQDSQSEEKIIGRWDLHAAVIDGEETDRLDNLYFEFSPEGEVGTNIFGIDESYQYTLDSEQINQASEPPLVYDLEWLSDSTISMVTQIRRKEFVLSLQRTDVITESSEVL
ncbi:MAG: hypothetical protein KTR24_08895 [Saprospiraceae bacterium]|nr:hypothetical protein [Saprospiraceae bacterium]